MANRTDLHDIAKQAAKEAVTNARRELREMINESFTRVGLNPDSPVQIQEMIHGVKQILDNESIKGLMQSGLTAEDFRKLKELCGEGDIAQIVHNSRETQQYKKGLWSKVTGGVVLGGIMATLGYVGGLLFGGGGGATPPVP